MEKVYKKLAQKLNELPQGFPPTESDVELKILKWIFEPEEAEIAINLPFEPETIDSIATRLGKPYEETKAILEGMLERKQIFCLNISGKLCYLLPPFFPGFHEFQVSRTDKTIQERKIYLRLYEEYYPSFMKKIGYNRPSLTRVVPVSTSIEARVKVHRLDDVIRILEDAKSINLMPCACRKEKALLGHTCKHSLETCITFSNQENILSRWQLGRTISKEDAIEVARKAEKEGLVHTTYNADDSGLSFLCACCSCCCNFLKGFIELKAPNMVAQSNFVAGIVENECDKCGICANERCPMDAIVEEDDCFRVLSERCIGCGVCVSTCPTGAITMVERPKSEQEEPASSMQEWAIQRTADSRQDS